MANTLLFLLEHVRAGKVKAFSMCLVVEHPNGDKTVESACADGDNHYEMQLLGAMRSAENNLFKRREERLSR